MRVVAGRRHLDPVLLAVSDVLVTVALERAASRVLPRSARQGLRHEAHERQPIHPDRLDRALVGAWVHCAAVAATWADEVDVAEWVELLDSYTRALLTMGQHHSATRLAPHLGPVGHVAPAVREFVAVG